MLKPEPFKIFGPSSICSPKPQSKQKSKEFFWQKWRLTFAALRGAAPGQAGGNREETLYVKVSSATRVYNEPLLSRPGRVAQKSLTLKNSKQNRPSPPANFIFSDIFFIFAAVSWRLSRMSPRCPCRSRRIWAEACRRVCNTSATSPCPPSSR